MRNKYNNIIIINIIIINIIIINSQIGHTSLSNTTNIRYNYRVLSII